MEPTSTEAISQETVSQDTPPEKASKKKKVLTIQQKFWARLDREGRKSEWYAAMKAVKAENPGKGYGQLKWEAMRRCGYQGAMKEHELWNAWEQEQAEAEAKKIDAAIQASKTATVIAESFDHALKGLPANASADAEINWVAAHPAMSRKDRMSDQSKPVIIDADDILRAPHGPAPSRAAVNRLQHWANCPHEFYKVNHTSDKKQSAAGAGKDADLEPDEDLSEVERLLKEVAGG